MPPTPRRRTPNRAGKRPHAADPDVLRLVLDSMDEACALYDAADRLVVCNKAFARAFTGNTGVAAPGTRFRDHVRWFLDRGLIQEAVGREAAWLRERMRRHRDPKEPFQIRNPKGRWFEIVERRTQDGGTLMLRRDVTALKQREAEVAAGEARFRALFENAPVAIAAFDYSAVKRRVDRLRARGVRDLAAYLKARPRVLRSLGAAIVPIDANRHAVRMHGARTRDETLALQRADFKAGRFVLSPAEIVDFAAGEDSAALEGTRRMRDGTERHLRARFFLDPAHRADWSRVIAVTEDVTELQAANRQLAAYRNRWRAFLDNAPMSIGIKDREGRFSEVSAFLARSWGTSPEGMVGRRVADLAPAAIVRSVARDDRAVIVGRMAIATHRSWPSIGGLPAMETYVVRFPIVDAGGAVVGTGFIETDVTEQVHARRALEETQARWQAFLDNAPMAIAIKDLKGRYQVVSRFLGQGFGMAPEEVAGLRVRDLADVQAAREVERHERAVMQTGQTIVEERHWQAAGNLPALEMLAIKFPIVGADGTALGTGAIEINISDQVRAQRELAASEALFRLVMDTLPAIVWMSDAQDRTTFHNKAWDAFTGIAGDNLDSFVWSDRVHPEDRARYDALYDRVLSSGVPERVEYRCRAADGRYRWLLESASPRTDAQGRFAGFVGTCIDVTDRKLAEEAVHAGEERAAVAERRLADAIEHLAEAISIYDAEERLVMANAQSRRAVAPIADLFKPGARFEDLLRAWIDRGALRDGEAPEAQVARRLALFRSGDATFEQRFGDRWVRTNDRRLEGGGIVTSHFDITELKAQQEALDDSRALLRTALDAVPASINVKDRDGRFMLVNRFLADLYGRTPGELEGWLAREVRPAFYAADVSDAQHEQVVTDGRPILGNETVSGAGHAREFWSNSKVPVLGEDGQVKFVVTTSFNITAIKQAQQALAESEARLHEAEERARLTHWHVEVETGRLAWSASAPAILGIAARDLPVTNEAFWASVHPDDALWYRAACMAAIRRGGATHYEFRFVRPDGRTIWLEEHGQVTLGPDGRCLQDVGTLQDITARKRAEGELRANRAKLADAQRRARLAYWEVEGEDRRYVWSEDAERVLGLEGVNLPDRRDAYFAMVAPEDRPRLIETYARAGHALPHWAIEYRLETPAGTQWISEVGETLPASASGGVVFAGTVQNVTERKLAEEELRRSRARLADAQRRARIAYWEWDLATGRYTWSDEVGLVLGREGDAIPRDNDAFLRIVAPEDRERIRARYRAIEASPAPYQIEYRVVAPGGGVLWMRELGEELRDAAGRGTGMVGTIQDVTAVKQAEEALRRNEALLRGVMDSVPGAINVKDRDGRYVMVNSFQAKNFSLSPSEFVGISHFDVGSNRAYDEWLASIEHQVLATGQGTGFFDDPFPAPANADGGQRTHWLTSKTPILDEQGAVSHIVGVSIDITARRQAEEEALRRGAALAAVSTAAVRFLAAAEWRDVMDETLAELGDSVGASACYVLCFDDAADDGTARVASIWVAPGEGSVRQMSKSASGYAVPIPARWREAWAAGRPTIGLASDMPADERALLEAEGIRSVAGLPIFRGQGLWGAIAFDQTDRDRVWTFAETDVLRAAASVIGAALARKGADDAAAESRAALMTVIDALPAYINAQDRSRRYTFLNRLEAQWLGVPAEAAIGKTLKELAPGRVLYEVDMFGRVLETGEPVEAYAEETTDIAGNPMTWVTTRTPLRRPDGRLEGVITVSVDITERKKLEEQLRQAQKMEAVGQLTGGIAHDFNNLLAVILGNLELVAEDLPPDDPLRAQVETGIRATLRGSELTHRLLAFARRQPLAPSIVDVNMLVGGMTDLLKRSLGNTIAVKTALSDGLWLTEVDYAQLETSILNLAINARDAMPKGGVLVIATANLAMAEDDPARLEEVPPGDYVAVTVRDNGTGMAPKVLARVFEPFFTTKGVGKGTGLGLSMVYGFVRQSGGQTRIASEPGKGTAVTLYLPRARDAAAALAFEAGIPAGAEGRGETVLVVEDEPAMRELAQRILIDMGYKVVLAEDGPTAMAALDATPKVDVMLVDVVLPGAMHGTAVAAAARERRPGLKVLFMSGYTATAVTQGGLLDPGVNLVPKPFRRAELATKLRQILAGSPG